MRSGAPQRGCAWTWASKPPLFRNFTRPYRKPRVPLSKRSAHGVRVWRCGEERGAAAAIPQLQRAVKEDPEFAAAVYDLGSAFRNSGQEERARDLYTRAFALRDHASIRKRHAITLQMLGTLIGISCTHGRTPTQVFRWSSEPKRSRHACSERAASEVGSTDEIKESSVTHTQGSQCTDGMRGLHPPCP